MRGSWRSGCRIAALALLAASCAESKNAREVEAGDGEGEIDADHDDATARRKAFDDWYNEARPEARDGRGGGLWSPEFRIFMLEAAARERARYLDRLPGTGWKPIVTGSVWSNIGPDHANQLQNGSFILNKTDAGRIRSIVVDPTNPAHVYVATSGGGVWESSDALATQPTWTPRSETLGTLACGSLAMDPQSPTTLYLGLGDPFDGTGIGLVESADGGATWSAPIFFKSGARTATQTPQVLVHSTNRTVLAATDIGLWRKASGGAWTEVTGGLPPNAYIWSISQGAGSSYVLSLEANPTATSGTTDGQVWRSTDDGVTWTRATGITNRNGIGRVTVAAAPSNRATMYAMAALPLSSSTKDLADIFKSADGGATWTPLKATTKRYTNANRESSTVGTLLRGQGWYDQLVIVHPTDPNLVYFGGALVLARTSDGGATFTQASNWLAQFSLPYVHADFHAASYSPDASRFYVGTDGGVFVTADGGATWSDHLNNGIVSHLLYSLGSSTADRDAVIGGMQDNGTRLRVDATATFNQVIGGDGFGSDIKADSASTMLGSLYYDRIMKSTDGGATFANACTGISECNKSSSAPFFTKVVAWPGDANTVFTHSNGKVYKSTNYAGSWSALGTTGIAAASFIIRNVNVATWNAGFVGLALTAGRVSLTKNGGTSWTETAPPPDNALSMSDVLFDANDTSGATVWVASVAADQNAAHLWKSLDSGTSWTIIGLAADDAGVGHGLPKGVPVNFIRNEPGNPTVLYAGTHLGIYRSTDAGQTWSLFGSGMPLVNVTAMYISPGGDLVRAATYGRGVWELTQ